MMHPMWHKWKWKPIRLTFWSLTQRCIICLLCWILLHTKSCLIEPVTISHKVWVFSPTAVGLDKCAENRCAGLYHEGVSYWDSDLTPDLWYIYTRIGTTLLGSNLDSSSIGNGSFTTHPTTTKKKKTGSSKTNNNNKKKHCFFSRWCTLSSPKHHPTKSSRESNLSPRGTDLWADSLIPKESWL